MRQDDYGFIVSDTSGNPANLGDSAAETGRWVHLRNLNRESFTPPDLGLFRTINGYVRHPSPELPLDWGESDFSQDQALPLYLAYRSSPSYQLFADEMRMRINDSGYRTGNGDLIGPMFFGILKQNKFIINIATAIQALLFKIPFRWSDSKKAFESTVDASGDYLNWFHGAMYASPWARRLVSKERLIERIKHYYRNEPNSEPLVLLYIDVINRRY